ncbi:putative DNA-binding pseudobarrel domain superfamily [Helianthus anomalus]
MYKTSTSLPAGTVQSHTPKKVHGQETLKKGDASHFKTMQDVKEKGKAKVFADVSETIENLNKECKGRQRTTKSDSIPSRPSADYVKLKAVQNVKHRKKVTRNARKVSGVGMDPEFFNFSHKGDYRLLNGGTLRYAVDGWKKFMADNQLEFGHMLHFTYVTSQKKIVLNDVTSI